MLQKIYIISHKPFLINKYWGGGVSQFPQKYIRMISEGTCDTDNYAMMSNDAENSALITEINYILQYIFT